ncbi:MAG: barstar family protein [Candidatus Sumerlaeia bacterium]
MENIDQIFVMNGPKVFLLAEPGGIGETVDRIKARYATPVVKILDCRKMQRVCRMFMHMKSVLEFPSYFGWNWNALDECLGDLEWLPGDAVFLIFTHGDMLLAKADDADLANLLQYLDYHGRDWAKLIDRQRDQFDEAKPPTIYHSIICVEPAELERTRRRFAGFAETLKEL